MKEIIKTWPAQFAPRHVLEVFTHDWGEFYFTVGRGKPKEEVDRLWYTHRYYAGFRGWRYFDLEEWRGNVESSIQL